MRFRGVEKLDSDLTMHATAIKVIGMSVELIVTKAEDNEYLANKNISVEHCGRDKFSVTEQ
jgi:hypothetical protein